MSNNYFEKMADSALHDLETLPYAELRRQVILVLKNVERDTRHRALDIVYRCASEVLNSNPGDRS